MERRSPRGRVANRKRQGAARPYWEPFNAIYNLDIKVVNPVIDPTFSCMTVDHDGKLCMGSSPYAMARLVGLKDRYRVAFANIRIRTATEL